MKGLIRKTFNSLRGDKRFDHFEEQSKLQWLSTEELRERQFKAVKKLLRHGVDTTTYYRTVMDELGITVGDIRDFDDFAKLPILTKSQVRDNPDSLISSAYNKADLIKNSSGGSTGEPLIFYQNREMWPIMNGCMMLCYSFMGWQPNDMVISIWGNPKEFGRKPSKAQYMKNLLAGAISLNAYKYNKSVMGEWAAEIKRHPRVFIYGYPSVLTDFSNYLLENGVPLSNVLGVMSSAEKLHDWQRLLFEQAFGCGVYDQYGSREIPGASVECEHGNMHLLTHTAYIEFAPDTQTGFQKIIATSLTSFGMPFIRYEIGDCGAPMEGGCECGRGFPLMKMDIGRIYDSFLTPEGDSIHGTYFVRLLAALKGIVVFQYVQRQRDRIELKLVRNGEFSQETQNVVDGLEARIKADVTPSLSLDVLFVDDIPRTGGGKHRYTICEVER